MKMKKMKKMSTLVLMTLLGLGSCLTAEARNTAYQLPIQTALSAEDACGKIDPTIKLYFADQAHPSVVQAYGSGVANKTTNSFGKSDEKACQWVLLSSLIALQNQAREHGANAIINIESYYKKNPMASQTLYECHAGAIIAGVALKGDYVRI